MKMSNIFFRSLRTALMGYPLELSVYNVMGDKEWEELYRLSVSQGVVGIIYEVIGKLPKELLPGREILINWALSYEAIKENYSRRVQISTEWAEELAKEGIRCVVLKGISASLYYPEPSLREFGDLDCFLFEDNEKGNLIAEKLGAKVERGYYKDTHIVFKGMLIENHLFCTPVRGKKQKKVLERELQGMLRCEESLRYFGKTKLLLPSVDFNLIHFTNHALVHFLSEGIKVRHILDFAVLLRKEQDNVDWELVYRVLEENELKVFFETIVTICVKELGLVITAEGLKYDDRFTERVLEDTLWGDYSVHNRGYSPWRSRYEVIRNMLSSRWKYRDIAGQRMLMEIFRTGWAFMFEKNPKL